MYAIRSYYAGDDLHQIVVRDHGSELAAAEIDAFDPVAFDAVAERTVLHVDVVARGDSGAGIGVVRNNFV